MTITLKQHARGTRVSSVIGSYLGTVVEVVPQTYADDLYVVAWDSDSLDTDLYAHSMLEVAAA